MEWNKEVHWYSTDGTTYYQRYPNGVCPKQTDNWRKEGTMFQCVKGRHKTDPNQLNKITIL